MSRDIKNLKAMATAFEMEISIFTNKILGSEFRLTQKSGGGNFGMTGDIFDKAKSTPLSRRCIEIKKHDTKRAFRAEFFNDVDQAITQTRPGSGLVWLLITKDPESDRYFVVQDYEDYLLMDIQSQMLDSKINLKKIFSNMRVLLRSLIRYIDKLEAGA